MYLLGLLMQVNWKITFSISYIKHSFKTFLDFHNEHSLMKYTTA